MAKVFAGLRSTYKEWLLKTCDVCVLLAAQFARLIRCVAWAGGLGQNNRAYLTT